MKGLSRVGEKHVTKEGYEIEIIEWFGWRNCTIQFDDKTIIKNRQYESILRGAVKHPYKPSVYNVGFIGIGKYNNENYFKIYTTWANMLRRAYSEDYQKRKPTYIGCSVVEKWLNFQNFANWHEQNYIEGFHLDKDILSKGNKIYSSETCCFVPNEINILFAKSNSNTYPTGVYGVNGRFKSRLSIGNKIIHLGIFNTPEEAFQAYKTAKETRIKQVADEWKHLIEEKVYQTLINYKVEITD